MRLINGVNVKKFNKSDSNYFTLGNGSGYKY